MSDLTMTWDNVLVYSIRAFAALFPLVNPFGVVPLFLGLTPETTVAERSRLATRACLMAGALMVLTLILGEAFMKVLGVSLPAVRIAVGLIISYMGFAMLFARMPSEIPTIEGTRRIEDFAFIPLGFPGLSGAGALSAMIAFATFLGHHDSLEEKVVGNLVVVSSVAAVLLVSWLILRIASVISKKTNPHGWEALGRTMGILKVCIGIQFAVNGVTGLIEAARAQT